MAAGSHAFVEEWQRLKTDENICTGKRKETVSYSKGREKGQSLLICPPDYTVIDLETTGLNPGYDEIIEAACVRYRDGQETERITSLIQPENRREDGRFIDPFIESLTGITNQLLETAPLFEEVGEKFWNFLEGEFIVGHNVNFDINFLYDIFFLKNGAGNFKMIFWIPCFCHGEFCRN